MEGLAYVEEPMRFNENNTKYSLWENMEADERRWEKMGSGEQKYIIFKKFIFLQNNAILQIFHII